MFKLSYYNIPKKKFKKVKKKLKTVRLKIEYDYIVPAPLSNNLEKYNNK